MTYYLKIKEGPHTPAMTITIAQTSPPDPLPTATRTWKAHMQYDDSTRQTSGTFETVDDHRLFTIFGKAMDVLGKGF